MSRLKNLSAYLTGLAVVPVMVSMTSCNPSNPITITGKVARDMDTFTSEDSSLSQPADWYLMPGGSMEALNAPYRYAVLATIDNRGSSIEGGLTTIIRSDNSALLIVTDLGSKIGKEKRNVHLDTDGHGYYLALTQGGSIGTQPFDIYISIKDAEGKEEDFASKLPAYKDMPVNGSLELNFQRIDKIPSLKGYRVIKKDEWSVPESGSSMLSPPALLRKQGGETSLYMDYAKGEEKQ